MHRKKFESFQQTLDLALFKTISDLFLKQIFLLAAICLASTCLVLTKPNQ